VRRIEASAWLVGVCTVALVLGSGACKDDDDSGTPGGAGANSQNGGASSVFDNSIYEEQPEIALFADNKTAGDGATIVEAFGEPKSTIEVDGYEFKDSDGDGELDPYEDWRLTPRERATDLVSQMSVGQKIGMLSFNGQRALGAPTTDDSDNTVYGLAGLRADGTVEDDTGAASIINNGIRSSNLFWGLDPVDSVKWLNNVQGLCERLPFGIPYLVTSEPNHDYYSGNYDVSSPPVHKLSPWPFYLGFGAIGDLSTTQYYGEVVRQEIRMHGRHAIFGPMGDLATEPRWARIQHTFHARGEVAANQLEVVIQSIQGADRDKNPFLAVDGVATVVKHFPGAGANEEGMDSHSAAGAYNVYPGGNFAEHLIPFQRAFESAGAVGTMSCYSIIDPSTTDFTTEAAAGYSKEMIDDLLRTQIGFDGFVVTDAGLLTRNWGLMDQELSDPELLAAIREAGPDAYLSADVSDIWMEAYNQGLITDEQIDEAAIRHLGLHFALGLFENPYVNVAEAEEFWDETGTLMRNRVSAGKSAMRKAIVLAKNEQLTSEVDVLPVVPRYLEQFDVNGNGTIDVWFDSVFEGADSGEADSYANSQRYGDREFVSDIADADVAIVRIFARGAPYAGTTGGVPLSFDGVTYEWDRDAQAYTTTAADDASMTGEAMGFFDAPYRVVGTGNESKDRLEAVIAAKQANPDLLVVVGMTASRPGILAPYIDDIDGLLIDFAATDDAFLDLVFWQDGAEPTATMPVELPADDESVRVQYEDVPCDTADPTFECGHGMSYRISGGY
jgi:beta-glucosidase